MKTFVCFTLFVVLGLAATQAVAADKTKCLLGIQLTRESLTGRLMQSTQRSANIPQAVSNLLAMYQYLNEDAKSKIKACNLNMAKALARCEAANGAGACEVDGFFAQVKCPAGTVKVGHHACATACPAGFEDKGYFCYKPAPFKSAQFKTQKECETTNSFGCEQWTLEFWVPKCKDGFRRIGADQCVPMCPDSWTDSGRMCFKPVVKRLSAPFGWTVADN